MKGAQGKGARSKGLRNLPQSLTLDRVSPATRLLEKRRQMFEVQEALDAQKEEFSRREEAFRRREEALRKKDLELQESLIKFNKFLQENESKRNRAEKRASEEAKLRKEKEQEIVHLKKKFVEMRRDSEKLRDRVLKNMKYQKFLEAVQAAVPEEYPEISDLLNRYRTLKEANADLLKRQADQDAMNERLRNSYAHYTKERTNEILSFNNQIASLQKTLESVESKARLAQSEIDHSIQSSADRTLELGQVLMAIENLLARCTCKEHGNTLKHIESIRKDDATHGAVGRGNGRGGAVGKGLRKGDEKMIELEEKVDCAVEQLGVIAAYLRDFSDVVEEFQESDPSALPSFFQSL